MSSESHVENAVPLAGGGASRLGKGARALVLIALLFVPLLAAELWARRQLDLIHPYITGRLFWADTKLLLLEQAGCPQVLSLGSSVSGRTIISEHVVGRDLVLDGGSRPVDSVFSYAIDGARATVLYGAWRQIRAQGCLPPYVFVEVAPTILNGHTFWHRYYAPVLDAATIWAMPSGFIADGPFQATRLVDQFTYFRFHLYRLRDAFRSALVERAGLRPFSGSRTPPAFDGVIQPPSNASLSGAAFERERKQRIRSERRGDYPYRLSELETDALVQLIAEATTAGSQVVAHAPPVTAIYRRSIARQLDDETFAEVGARLRAELASTAGHSAWWYWCYEGPGLGPALFADWIHVNRRGGKRYADGLFSAIADGRSDFARCAAPADGPS